MELIEMAKMTSKGQVTVPASDPGDLQPEEGLRGSIQSDR